MTAEEMARAWEALEKHLPRAKQAFDSHRNEGEEHTLCDAIQSIAIVHDTAGDLYSHLDRIYYDNHHPKGVRLARAQARGEI